MQSLPLRRRKQPVAEFALATLYTLHHAVRQVLAAASDHISGQTYTVIAQISFTIERLSQETGTEKGKTAGPVSRDMNVTRQYLDKVRQSSSIQYSKKEIFPVRLARVSIGSSLSVSPSSGGEPSKSRHEYFPSQSVTYCEIGKEKRSFDALALWA